jgi:HlyD family secretion protein
MRRWLLATAVLALAAAFAAGVPAVRTTSVAGVEGGLPEARAVRRDIEVSVVAVGELRAARSTTITSQVGGDRGKIVHLAADGAKVEPGDILVRLDRLPFEEEVRSLEAQVQELTALVEARSQAQAWERSQAEREYRATGQARALAGMELERVEKGEGLLELARLESEASEARRETQKSEAYSADLEALRVRGYAPEAEIALARSEVEGKRERLSAATRQLEGYRDFVLPLRIREARAGIEKADLAEAHAGQAVTFRTGKAQADLREALERLAARRVRLESAGRELEATVIRAPIPGLVVLQEEFRAGERRKPRVGDTVWPGQPLLTLPDLSALTLATQVRELDLHKVALGLPVEVTVEAYPGLTLAGTVEAIGVLAEKDPPGREPGKYFSVGVAIAGTDERLRPGMTAVATIRSRTVRDALAIPLQAVFERGGSTSCYVIGEEGARLREIVVGTADGFVVEVTSGLRLGERVSLAAPGEALSPVAAPEP